ncbi:MAG TPA: FxSxx-COOH system tetratricopeptide repeat protein [Ktedonobacteraceae bacterium]|nr:FxSxx-COOH system tetratricopeptide repeat protein [Ktedonobacteraceae bacterium]
MTEQISFGDVLKTFRKRQRISQRVLAELLGVHRNTIWSWEQGSYLPDSKGMVLELAKLLVLNEKETQQLLEASLTALSSYWRLPFQRNLFFTGREEILHSLHDTLRMTKSAALVQSYVLSGLGGIGKTQIAVEYAYRYHHDYTAVFWLAAETAETLFDSFTAVSRVLDLPTDKERDQYKIVEQVLNWLNMHKEWLVIFDNVEDLQLIKAFLPTARQGALLFTSRLHVFDTLAHPIELQPLSLEEGTHLLLRRARMLHREQTDAQLSSTDLITAHTIVQELGGLPLALDQAGAYIEATRCSLEDYLHLFRSSQGRLLDERASYTDHPLSVSKTFTLAFEQLERNNPSAAELLTVCAFLSSEAIPETFFSKGAEHLGPRFKALVTDPFRFHEAIKALLTYSLLQRNTSAKTLTIHRLMQAVLKGSLTEDDQRIWAAHVAQAMAQLFPTNEVETDYWQVCEQLLPHALVCIALSEQWNLDKTQHITLLNRVASYLSNRARYDEAKDLFLKALRISEQVPGSEVTLTAEALNGLAYLYYEQGKYNEAEPLFLRTLRIREEALGPDHPWIAGVLSRLGSLYQRQGRYREAKPLLERALHIREQELGPDHPSVAASLNNLAVTYLDQDQYADAQPLIERALRIWQQALGPEHPLVAMTLNNLAMTFSRQGKYKEAEPLFLQALQIRERVLGPEHPLVAYVLHNLAALYNKQDRLEEAESVYQRALRIREQALGPEHPMVAYPLDGLGIIYAKQGKYEEARRLYQRALRIREQALGAEHPLVEEVRSNLAALEREYDHSVQ